MSEPFNGDPPTTKAWPAHAELTALFGEPEELNGNHRCETYLYRWTISKSDERKVYLHHFVGDDWSRDLHDHPKRFLSIGLRGSYVETWFDPALDREASRIFEAPWVREFPAEHRHRLTLRGDECWTLVIVGPTERDWGFWSEEGFVPWEQYVRGDKAYLADAAKACP